MGKLSEVFNFDDIGKKIKEFTKWYCWITIVFIWVGAVVALFVLTAYYSELWFVPLVAAIVGPFAVWISCWPMYAFGELVDNSTNLKNQKTTIPPSTGKQTNVPQNNKPKTGSAPAKKTTTKEEQNSLELNDDDFFDVACPTCGKMLTFIEGTTDAICPWCNREMKIKY